MTARPSSRFKELQDGVGEADDGDDPDMEILPKLVEKVCAPRVTEWLAHVWDPLSTAGTAKALGCVADLLVFAAPGR